MCHYAHQKLFTRENINQDIWNDFFCKKAVNQSLNKSSGIFLVTRVAPECKLGTLCQNHTRIHDKLIPHSEEDDSHAISLTRWLERTRL